MVTMTLDLPTWLRTQLDADEQTARAAMWAGDERWTAYEFNYVRDTWHVDDSYDEGVASIQAQAADSEAVARHIVRQQPLNVLADIAAKRRILAVHVDQRECERCTWLDDEFYACETLRLLALPYADRPGYDEGWKP